MGKREEEGEEEEEYYKHQVASSDVFYSLLRFLKKVLKVLYFTSFSAQYGLFKGRHLLT